MAAAMSATMDAAKASAYLGVPEIGAEGRAYPVAVRYDAGDAKLPVWERAARAVRGLVEEGCEGDALVFMPGGYEIDRTIDAVRAQLRGVPGGAKKPPTSSVWLSCERDSCAAPASTTRSAPASRVSRWRKITPSSVAITAKPSRNSSAPSPISATCRSGRTTAALASNTPPPSTSDATAALT
jgi:hypothetical protein